NRVARCLSLYRHEMGSFNRSKARDPVSLYEIVFYSGKLYRITVQPQCQVLHSTGIFRSRHTIRGRCMFSDLSRLQLLDSLNDSHYDPVYQNKMVFHTVKQAVGPSAHTGGMAAIKSRIISWLIF